MFKTVLSQYITTNMTARNWKLKDLARESGLSDSTLNAYILQKTSNPVEENLLRIARAFGDSPEIIHRMRRDAYEVSKAEEKMIAEAADKQRMEKFVEAIRDMLVAIMDDFRTAFAAQQTEIIQDADKRIEDAHKTAVEMNNKVAKQCKDEMDRKDKECAEKIDLMDKHCRQRIEDMHAHMTDVINEKGKSEEKLSRQYSRNRAYLIKTILCLGAIILILLTTNIFFGAYAIFAYTTFDMQDLARGLHRENYSIGPMMLFLAIVAFVVSILLIVWLYVSRPKHDEDELEKEQK